MPILDPNSFEFISRGAEQTRRIGMRLGALLQNSDLICLVGELGSGKTTLVQGMAAGWGSLDKASSPSFVLVNVYRRPDGMKLYHLDAYRLSSAREAEDLDLDAMLDTGPMVVEWAEKIQDALPLENLHINLSWIDEDQRDIIVNARGERYEKILSAMRKQIFGVT